MKPPRVFLHGLLAAALAGGPLGAQDAPKVAEHEVRELISDYSRAPDAVKWFAKNRARITPDLLTATTAFAGKALDARRFDVALMVYDFEALAYLDHGEFGEGLRRFIDSHQIRFMLADTPKAYAELRVAVRDTQKKADSIKRADLAFKAAVLVADCSYWEGVDASPTKDEWMIATLTDVEAALQTARSAPDAGFFERLVSLTGATTSKAMEQFFIGKDKTKAEALLKKVAAETEKAVPADFAYTLAAPQREKTFRTAEALASLSYRYGNAATASARLSIAAERARQNREVELWLELVSARYQGERQAGVPDTQIRQLRTQARSVAQELRGSYRSRAGRIWIAHSFDESYGGMLKDELEDPRASAAPVIFAAVEALKARTLLDHMRSAPSEFAVGDPSTQARALESKVLGFSKDEPGEEKLIEREMKLVSQLSSFGPHSGPERMQALVELERLHASAKKGFGEVAAPAELGEIQKALQPREAILEFSIPYHPLHPAISLWIFWITHDGFQSIQVPLDKFLKPSGMIGRMSIDGRAPIDSSPLGDLIVGLRTAIQRSDEKESRRLLAGFYQMLIQPMVAKGFHPQDFARLVIVPHGVLHYVPFPALIDPDGKFLIQHTALTVSPSASVWFALQKRAGPAPRFTGFANPTLERASNEVEKIAALLASPKDSVHLGDAGEHFSALAPAANLLHIATHGEFPDENAIDLHGFLLSRSHAAPVTIRASEIRQLNLSSSRLAVLSVCNGGLYRIGPADEPYGLVPAFLEAGVQNVMATLWSLDDQFAPVFMHEFYRHLMADGPAEAYRQACLRSIEQDEFLRRWAGFILVGPGRPFGP